jgi:hypothetical protein
MSDNVKHPSHCTAGKYEVIDIIESIVNSMKLSPFEGYMLGNTLKYLARFKNKNGTEDLNKAKEYLEMLIKDQEDKENVR